MLVVRKFFILYVFILGSWPLAGFSEEFSQEIAPLSPNVELRMDYAGLRRLPKGVASVVLGNPAIADVTFKDDDLIILSAKNYGRTNLILLGLDGKIIMETDLQVSLEKDSENRLVIYRGFERETYACSPNCAAILRIGDKGKHFNASINQSNARRNFILGSSLSKTLTNPSGGGIRTTYPR